MKYLKQIITSTLLAIGFGSLSVSTTFSLLTDGASSSINVVSGVVNLSQTMKITGVASLNTDDINTHTDDTAFFCNGGYAEIKYTNEQPTKIDVKNLTPGDKLILTSTPSNNSNVDIKRRLRIDISGELGSELSIKATNSSTQQVYGCVGERTVYSPWTLETSTGALETYNIEVSYLDSEEYEVIRGGSLHFNQKATISFSYEAVQANSLASDDRLELVNSYLSTKEVIEGKNSTMYEAVQDLISYNNNLNAFSDCVWSSELDQLVLESSVTNNKYKYFKIYDSMPDEQTFSIYASDSWQTTEINDLTVGFDAGNNGDITSVNFDRSDSSIEDAVDVIIRTKSGALNINGYVNQEGTDGDVIHHYGESSLVNIIKCANGSYHEFGGVAQMILLSGHVSLEETSIVGALENFDEPNEIAQTNNVRISIQKDAVVGNLILKGEQGEDKHISLTAYKGSKTVYLNNKNEVNMNIVYKTGAVLYYANTEDKEIEQSNLSISGVAECISENDVSTSGWNENLEEEQYITKDGSSIVIDTSSGAFKYTSYDEEEGSYQENVIEYKGDNRNKFVNGEGTVMATFASNLANSDILLNRVGNKNEINLGNLFKLADEVEPTDLSVSYETISGNATFAITQNNDNWAQTKVKFSGEGVVKVTIKDGDSGTPEVLPIEVFDAKNIYTNTNPSATTEDVVVLTDLTFGVSEIKVNNGHTLYGNGNLIKFTGTQEVKTFYYGYVSLNDGNIDGLMIDAPKFNDQILFTKQYSERSNCLMNSVVTDGNSSISNCYISGARNGVYLNNGELNISDTLIDGGAVANIQINQSLGVKLHNITTIQTPTESTISGTSNTLIGFGILQTTPQDGTTAPIELTGYLNQYNWVCSADRQYVESTYETFINTALSQTNFLHNFNNTQYLNTGFVFMPSEFGYSVPTLNITDNRDDIDVIPYDSCTVSGAKVYSYRYYSNIGTNLSKNFPYEKGIHGIKDLLPTIEYTDSNELITFSKKKDEDLGKHVYTFDVKIINSSTPTVIDLSSLKVKKYNQNINFDLYKNNTKINSISVQESGVFYYEIRFIDSIFYDFSGKPINKVTNISIDLVVNVTVASIKKPHLYSETTPNKVVDQRLLVKSSSSSDWQTAVSAAINIQVVYYDYADNAHTVDLANDLTFASGVSLGELSNTNSYTYVSSEDWKLTIESSGFHSSRSDNGKPYLLNDDGVRKIYFGPASTNGFVQAYSVNSNGTSNGTLTRAPSLKYTFTDPNNNVLAVKTLSCSISYDSSATKYIYTDFQKGTFKEKSSSSGGGGSCLVEGTKVSLSDNKYINIEDIKAGDMLKAFDHETGENTMSPVVFNDCEERDYYNIIHLNFANGSELKVVSEHGFFDTTLMKYVYIDEYNYESYIGHEFYAENGEKVVLSNAYVKNEFVKVYSPVTAITLNYYTENMLSMPGGIKGLFNIFDYDETLKYDEEKMRKDIEQYGLLDYSYFEDLIPYDVYIVFNGKYLGIAMAKGILLEEDLYAYIERYGKYWNID